MRISYGLLALVSGFALFRCQADELVLRRTSHQGDFRGFEKNQFLFQEDYGDMIKADRTKVRRLNLNDPPEVELLQSGAKEAQKVNLLNYDGLKFTIEQDGRKKTVIAMRVENIKVLKKPESVSSGFNGPAATSILDFSALEGRQDLTAAQQAALDQYKQVIDEYRAFRIKSSQLVQEMDRAAGNKREELLDVLRLRKGDEQAVLRKLAHAEQTLLTAIPKPWPKTEPAPTIYKKISLDIIDTAPLTQTPNMTGEQRAVLQNYKAAVQHYKKAFYNQAGAEVDQATAALQQAERKLLEAFPHFNVD